MFSSLGLGRAFGQFCWLLGALKCVPFLAADATAAPAVCPDGTHPQVNLGSALRAIGPTTAELLPSFILSSDLPNLQVLSSNYPGGLVTKAGLAGNHGRTQTRPCAVPGVTVRRPDRTVCRGLHHFAMLLREVRPSKPLAPTPRPSTSLPLCVCATHVIRATCSHHMQACTA